MLSTKILENKERVIVCTICEFSGNASITIEKTIVKVGDTIYYICPFCQKFFWG
jgi:hypothetical protein